MKKKTISWSAVGWATAISAMCTYLWSTGNELPTVFALTLGIFAANAKIDRYRL